MKQIDFLEVGMKNFGPYIDPMILTFENDKVTMLIGPNGVGKTMALDAIPFTLYGITSKNAKGDDVVNNKKKKDCHTWVKFKVNEDVFLVNRYQKFKSVGNTVILVKNGKEIKKGHKEVLPEIERILCPSKTFMNTLMFGQKVKDFFTDLTDSDKKQIFRNLLGLDNYVLYYDETKKQISLMNVAVDEMKRKITASEAVIEKIKNLITEDRLQKEKFEAEKVEKLKYIKFKISETSELLKVLETNIKIYDKIEDRLAEVKSRISNIVEKLTTINEELEVELNDIKAKAKAREDAMSAELTQKANVIKNQNIQDVRELRSFIKKKDDESAEVIEKFKEKKTKAYLDVKQSEADLKLVKTELLNIEQNLNQGTCPTCFQPIGKERIESLKTLKNEKEQLLSKIEAELVNKQKAFEAMNMLIDDALESKQQFSVEQNAKEIQLNKVMEDELEVLRGQFKEAKKKIQELREKLIQEITQKYADDKVNFQQEHAKLNTSYLTLQSEYSDYQTQKEKLDNQRTSLAVLKNNYENVESQNFNSQEQNLQKQLRNEENVLDGIYKECDTVFRKINILEFWKDAFSPSGIPSMLVDEAIPFMNRKISEYLDKLTNGRYIVSFDTLSTTKSGEFRDKISVNLLDTYTQANSRVQFSGGQTRIVDIATILTLGDLQSNIQNVKINLLLFDEIFDSLDSENIGSVAKVMNKIKEGKSIYIISHTHQEDIEVDETLMIGK